MVHTWGLLLLILSSYTGGCLELPKCPRFMQHKIILERECMAPATDFYVYTTRAIQAALWWCHSLAVWNLVLISRNMRHCCCFCEHSCNNTHSNLAHLSFSYLHLPTQCCVALHTIGHLRLYLCALFKTALITPYFVITDI